MVTHASFKLKIKQGLFYFVQSKDVHKSPLPHRFTILPVVIDTYQLIGIVARDSLFFWCIKCFEFIHVKAQYIHFLGVAIGGFDQLYTRQ